MKPSHLLPKLLVLIILSAVARLSYGDFGEIDLMVRESVETYFRKDSQIVDFDRLVYSSEPQSAENVLIISTSVWVAQQQEPPDWQQFHCTTKIEIQGHNQYLDHGTLCMNDSK